VITNFMKKVKFIFPLLSCSMPLEFGVWEANISVEQKHFGIIRWGPELRGENGL
jgi:hypothetical protein